MSRHDINTLKQNLQALSASKRSHAADLLASAEIDDKLMNLIEDLVMENSQLEMENEQLRKAAETQLPEKDKTIPGTGTTNVYISANNVALGDNINHKLEMEHETGH